MHRYGRIWQTGSWQRSVGHFRKACELVRNGRIGKVDKVEVGLPTGGGGGNNPVQPVPEGVDWDFWLGPAPWVPYRGVMHWHWRWIMDYSGGQLTDWAGHHVDIAHWGLGLDRTGPVEIEGKGVYPEDGMYDAPTQYKFTCKYANGLTMIVANDRQQPKGMGAMWYGEKGWIHVNRGGLNAEPKSVLDEVIGPDEIKLYNSRDHTQNFLDCVKSRKETVTPVEIAHRSISVGLLGEIAMLTGEKLKWNPEKEIFLNSDKANRLLSRPMRAPWHI
jgi:predicted dehydrogenase